MIALSVLALALAAAEPEAPPAVAPEAAATEEPEPDLEITVYGDRDVARARDALHVKLRGLGYRRHDRDGDRVVYKHDRPWRPQLVVHDDGYVYTRRQPPRVHSPGRSFADQGSPAEYLLCVIAPTTCVSVGGWLIGERKLARLEQDVIDDTRAEAFEYREAIARHALAKRLNDDIPADLERIWAQATLQPETRRALLFTYWDTRTDTKEGDAAKRAIEAFLIGEVQASAEPYTPAELAGLNARRSSVDPLVLPFPPG